MRKKPTDSSLFSQKVGLLGGSLIQPGTVDYQSLFARAAAAAPPASNQDSDSGKPNGAGCGNGCGGRRWIRGSVRGRDRSFGRLAKSCGQAAFGVCGESEFGGFGELFTAGAVPAVKGKALGGNGAQNGLGGKGFLKITVVVNIGGHLPVENSADEPAAVRFN